MNRIIARRPHFRHMPQVHDHLKRQSNCQNHVAANIIDDENGIDINLAIPGMKKSEIDIYVKDDVLFIEAKSQKQKNKSQEYKLKQFDFSNFKKRFQLSDIIDTEKIDATYEEGILSIKLSKKSEKETQKKKKIVIS